MMTHAVKFLQLVEDAKLRIRETTVDEVNDDLDAAADFVLVDTREESKTPSCVFEKLRWTR